MSRYRHDRSCDLHQSSMLVIFPFAPLSTVQRTQLLKLQSYYELNPLTTLFLCHVAQKLYLKELDEYFVQLLGNGFGHTRNLETACIRYLPSNRRLLIVAPNSNNMRALRVLFISALLTGEPQAKYEFTTAS